MANYSKEGSISLNAFNDVHDTKVTTTYEGACYDTIKDILLMGQFAVKSATKRKFVPVENQARGEGSAKQYVKGQIFIVREGKGNACIDCLVPKDDDLRKDMKAKLMVCTYQGVKPTDVQVRASM